MTFLYDDIVLAKFLSDAGLLNRLYKSAQMASEEARDIALKLAKNLLTNNTNVDGKDSDLFVKDLVDLDAFLNYLLKNERRTTDGHSIVFHDGGINGQRPADKDKSLYLQYKDFWVYKDALLQRLEELDIAANQAGSEVMKPLLKNLIAQVNSAFGTSFEGHGKAPPNPYGEDSDKEQGSYKGVKDNTNNSNIGENSSDPNYQNVSMKNKSKQNKTAISQEEIDGLKNTAPFQSSKVISPYDIQYFISSMFQFLGKHQDLIVGPIFGQFERFSTDIVSNFTVWQNWISETTGKAPQANIQALRDEVPYDRGNRPTTTLETLFVGNIKAKEAAQQLLRMVTLAHQALLSINRSPQLVNLLSKEFLTHQTNEAQAFEESLTPFSRS